MVRLSLCYRYARSISLLGPVGCVSSRNDIPTSQLREGGASGCYGNRIFPPQTPISMQTSCGYAARKYWTNPDVLDKRKCGYHGNYSSQPFNVPTGRAEASDDAKTKAGISIKQFILNNSNLCRDHLTPEIALHLMTPDCRLWGANVEQSSRVLEDHGIDDPFWAFYWPGGQALTR